MRACIIDNNDSFTRNLEHLVAMRIGSRPGVVPVADIGTVDFGAFDLIVVSPGPGRPSEYAGYGRLFDSGTPVLGICLGMQLLNEHFGGSTARLAGCVHGRTDTIEWQGAQRAVARYHSLHAATVGGGLAVLAANVDGVPMALAHETRPLIGYQFHPESFMTPHGGEFIDHATVSFGLLPS